MQGSIQKFLHYLQHEEGCATNTILAYKNDLMQFSRFIDEDIGHSIRPEDLSEENAETYLARLYEKGYRPSTIYRKLAAVRSFLDFLREQGLLMTASMSDRLQPPPSERKIPLVLSKEDVAKLLQAPMKQDSPLAVRDRAILELIYGTGFRVGDVIELKLENINLEQTLVQTTERISTLGNAAEPLRDYINSGRPHLVRDHEEQALFLNQRGKGLTRQGLWLIVKRWSKEANIGKDVSPHTIRHSLVAHLLNEGQSIRQVQKKLGMKSPNSIRIFTALHGKAGSN